jgi:hypothetical protein
LRLTSAVRLNFPIRSHSQLDEGRSPEVVDSSQSEERSYALEAGSVPSIGLRQPLGDGSSEPFLGHADRLSGLFAAEPSQSKKAVEVLSEYAIGRNTGHRQSRRSNSSLSHSIASKKNSSGGVPTYEISVTVLGACARK